MIGSCESWQSRVLILLLERNTCRYSAHIHVYMYVLFVTSGGGLALFYCPWWGRCFMVMKWPMNLISSDVTELQAFWFTMCIKSWVECTRTYFIYRFYCYIQTCSCIVKLRVWEIGCIPSWCETRLTRFFAHQPCHAMPYYTHFISAVGVCCVWGY